MITKHFFNWTMYLVATIALVACSDVNPGAPGENQIHPTSWVIDHSLEADLTGCTDCHGSDFQGSGGAVSCYSCHYDGPPFGVHPSSWTDAYVDHRAYVTANGFLSCAIAACHGTAPFVQGGIAAPSCGSSDFTNANGVTHSCHSGHITGASWLLPAAHAASAIADATACWVCHNLTVPNGAIPACRDCHTVSAPNYLLGTCNSCHNNPPGTGEHNKHVVDKGYSCQICHYGYGTNTLGHWYPDPNPPADVAFGFAIDSQIQAGFTYNGTSCNGTCHGTSHNETW